MRDHMLVVLAMACTALTPASAKIRAQDLGPVPRVQSATVPAGDGAATDTTSDARIRRPENLANPWWVFPDLLGFSGGAYDFDRNPSSTTAADFQLEHRWGVSLLPKISHLFNGWDPTFQMRPMAGLEGTSDGALYGYGGFAFDLFIGRHLFLSPNEAVGAYYAGNGKALGSVVEFRSTLDVGYRFGNNLRLSASFGHISNANLTHLNPGTEILSANILIPTHWIH